MSYTVDSRVVELGFENKEFQSGVKDTQQSIASLKESLNFDESVKSMGNISKASKSFSLGKMAEGVSGISNRFSAMGIVGMTVIQNLTNAAINYGRKLVHSIMNPMKMGFSEYETQMNAIQTVLANTESKGTTLDDVGKALDELNTYADKTIYNFTEMTRNIGTFTAAGVDLETSTAAIKGIANLAAVSGSNSQQASVAMYQLSQALSSGTVKLMDWNSVVNAGMGGQVFQDALMETARVSGIAIDDLIDKHGSFRETLSTGWLSSEVLLDTLQKFTGDLTKEQLLSMGYAEDQIDAILRLGEMANDAATKVKTLTQLQETLQEAMQSGWTQTWELIIGDFEEAKAFFTEVSDTLGAIIQANADARNEFVKNWVIFGGRTAAINTLRNAFDALLSIIAPIKQAFQDIFPQEGLRGYGLAKITEQIEEFSEKLKLTEEGAEKVRRIFKGVFSIFDIGKDVIFTLGEALFNLIKKIPFEGGGIIDFLADMGDSIVEFRDGFDFKESFYSSIERIKDIFFNTRDAVVSFSDTARTKLENIKQFFSDIFGKINIDLSGLRNVLDIIKNIEINFDGLGPIIEGIKDLFSGLSDVSKKLGPRLLDVFKSIGKAIGFVAKAMFGLPFLLGSKLFDKLGQKDFGKVYEAIGEFLSGLGERLSEAAENIDFDKVSDAINTGLLAALVLSIRGFLKSGSGVFDGLTESIEGLIGDAGGIFKGPSSGITGVLDSVRTSIEAWQTNIKAKTMLKIAGAVAILAGSLLVLSLIDSEKLTGSIAAITALFANLMASFALYSKMGGGGLKSSAGLIAVSVAVLIMAGAMKKIASIDQDDMKQGILGIYALVGALILFSTIVSKNTGKLIKSAVGLVIFTLALLALTGVVKRLGNMDPEVMAQGLKGVGIMLAEVAAFLRLLGDSKGLIKAALGMMVMTLAILVLAKAVQKFGEMNVDEMQQGLIAVGIILAEIAIFTRLMGDGKKIIATAIGMTIIAAAMLIFSDVLTKLGNMSWDEIGRGLVGMGGSLLILAGAARIMPKNLPVLAIGIAIMAASLLILSQALKSMGSMSWDEIGRGLAVLAGSMAILAVALYVMSGTLMGSAALLVASGALMILAGVLKILGEMSLQEIGMSLLALAGVFLVLGIAGYLLAPVVGVLIGLGAALLLLGVGAALVGVALMAFSAGLTALAVSGAAAGVGLAAFVTSLIALIPMIIAGVVGAIILFVKLIIKAIPLVGKAITLLLMTFLQIIIDTTPKLIETLRTLLDALISLIVEMVPDFIDAILFLIGELLASIAEKVPEFVQSGFDILIGFLKGVRDNIGEVVTTALEIVAEFLRGLAEGIPDVIDAGIELVVSFIQGLADGIEENSSDLNAAVGNLVTAIIKGFTDGLTSGVGSVVEAIGKLGGAAVTALKTLLGIFSPSRVSYGFGENYGQGFINGILALVNKVAPATDELGDRAVDGMKSAISRITNAVTSDIDMEPTIRPVIDMSDLERSRGLVDSIFADRPLNLVPALETSSRISSNLGGLNVDSDGNLIRGETQITLNQNNYSPKALSRVEIYRQTRNQLLTLEGLVDA